MPLLETKDTIETDILVIGGGGAGLRAAIEARRRGAGVLLVSKFPAGFANNTAIALGGISVATGGGDPQDGPEAHLRDTVAGGRFVNNQELVEVMTRGGHDLLRDLASLGVEFAERGGAIRYTRTAGHSYPRSVMTRARKGLGFTQPLRQQALNLGVRIQEGVLITSLVQVDGAVVGATGLDNKGNLFAYRAKATILATGGAGQLYEQNDNAKGIAGDGYALAYDLGLPLTDMEFVQFTMLAFEVTLGARGVLQNSLGEDILEKYGVTSPSQSTRDVVSRLCMREVKAGRGIDGAVVYDLTRVPQERLERVYPFLEKKLAARLAAGERRLPVLPAVHFFMGGVQVDRNGATALKGLYGAGEVVGGVHGANRLAGNALTEVFVFGAIAGGQAGEYARRAQTADIAAPVARERERLGSASVTTGGQDIAPLRQALRSLMWRQGGVARDEAGLKQGLEELKGLQKELGAARVKVGPDLIHLVETTFMASTAEMVLRAALARTESRGAHFRLDHPDEDGRRWLQNIVITKQTQGMHLSFEPVKFTRVAPEAKTA